MFDNSGALVAESDRKPDHALITVTEQGAIAGGYETLFSGAGTEFSLLSGVDEGGIEYAFEINSTFTTTIAGRLAERFGRRFVLTLKSVQPQESGDTFFPRIRWTASLEGRGTGAIGADGRPVVAMADGRFIVFGADGESETARGIRVLETRLPFSPYDISIIPPGYALLSRSAQGAVSLHFVDAQGHDAWSAPVPFTPSEPPIDGGNGRIYLVGDGFAAYEDGKVLWSSRASGPQYATAYEDGVVALAAGPELRFIGRDGAVLQSFRTDDGAPITTPPAIADDGSVWVATANGLYVAR